MLNSVTWINLKNDDLVSIPSEHLASLVSCVKLWVEIEDVRNGDIISTLARLKCEMLRISSQTLSSEETRALVRAMETGVENVELGFSGEVSLDITALTQYSGQGKCRWLTCCRNTRNRYR